MIVLGSANVGKTCLLQRYLTGNFNDETISVGIVDRLNVKLWLDTFMLCVEHWCIPSTEEVGGLEHCIMGEFSLTHVDVTVYNTL